MNENIKLASALLAVTLGTGLARDVEASGTAQQAWWNRIQDLCGQAFAGTLTRFDEQQDADWIDADMVMHVRECADDEIRIPLHVGGDRSRTWVLTRTGTGIQLKHDHRHEDGSEDVLTQYGGHTRDPGTPEHQAFPADDHSKALFEKEGIPDSMHNTWHIELVPGERFSYGLKRFNRDFQATFDLGEPVELPPAPWGAGTVE